MPAIRKRTNQGLGERGKCMRNYSQGSTVECHKVKSPARGACVHLRSLQLTNYRNFRRLALTLEDGPTIIQGENAQGKTNLLEAIELMATTKSARAGTERELINWAIVDDVQTDGSGLGAAEPFARVAAVTIHERGETQADILIRALSGASEDDRSVTTTKTFRVNGVPRRALEFVGEINVVSFSPEDVDLVAGSPAGR